MREIIFNNKKSYTDLGLTIQSLSVGYPNKRKMTETLPYISGQLDYSRAGDEPIYDEREITIVFNIIPDRPGMVSALTLKSDVINWLMEPNNKTKLIDTFNPAYYYEAEVVQAPTYEDKGDYGYLTVIFSAYPFKMSVNYQGEDKWDLTDFRIDQIKSYKFPITRQVKYYQFLSALRVVGGMVEEDRYNMYSYGCICEKGDQFQVSDSSSAKYAFYDEDMKMIGGIRNGSSASTYRTEYAPENARFFYAFIGGASPLIRLDASTLCSGVDIHDAFIKNFNKVKIVSTSSRTYLGLEYSTFYIDNSEGYIKLDGNDSEDSSRNKTYYRSILAQSKRRTSFGVYTLSNRLQSPMFVSEMFPRIHWLGAEFVKGDPYQKGNYISEEYNFLDDWRLLNISDLSGMSLANPTKYVYEASTNKFTINSLSKRTVRPEIITNSTSKVIINDISEHVHQGINNPIVLKIKPGQNDVTILSDQYTKEIEIKWRRESI